MKWIKIEKPKTERLIIIILLGLLLIFGTSILMGDFHFYSIEIDKKINSSKTNSLLSALIQSMAAVLAIVFALTVFAIQMSAQTYSPRVITLHAASPYFIVPFMMFLLTLIYLIIFFGKRNSSYKENNLLMLNLGILFSIFAFSLLIPLAYRTINLLKPAILMKTLMGKIKSRDFAHYYDNPENIRNKLQPILDTIKTATQKNDQQTAIEGLDIIERKCSQFILGYPEREVVIGIVLVLGKSFADLCFYSNQTENIIISKKVINTIGRLTTCIINKSTIREPVYSFFEVLNKIDDNTMKRFPKDLYQSQLYEIKEIIADCRLKIIEVYK